MKEYMDLLRPDFMTEHMISTANIKSDFIINEYEFKAVITGKIIGESYMDALENMFIPGMMTEITKVKLKDIDKVGEIIND